MANKRRKISRRPIGKIPPINTYLRAASVLRNMIRRRVNNRRGLSNRELVLARMALSRAGRKKFAANYWRKQQKKQKKTITATAAGTTHTTTRMIVRRTPYEQKFLRKMFRNNPSSVKHIQRFGFSWIGAKTLNKTIWYSVCHNKFNNIYEYMMQQPQDSAQNVGQTWPTPGQALNAYATNPARYIYLGKCTFQYELYNPTNYLITVYIYDLVCRHDTPYDIGYGALAANETSSAPEICMYYGSQSNQATDATNKWYIGDPTAEATGTLWDTVGMKPTDFMSFNVLWKVKGIKKIVLPPMSSHHHVVVFNPKKKVTLGSLLYPRMDYSSGLSKKGIAGITQATLFGFEGQVAINDPTSDTMVDSTDVGTLPGKLVVKCIRKVSTYNFSLASESIIQKNNLVSLAHPVINQGYVEEANPEVLGADAT